VRTNWYETFFHGLALELWRRALAHQPTGAEVDFLVEALARPAGARILDVPCGNGRHALELARRGYDVTGLDISEEFLDEARARGAAEGVTVECLLGDMRRIPGEPASYDGAFCFGNSFGYLELDDMRAFLAGVGRILRPGARFVVETGMAAESVLPRFSENESFAFDDLQMTITSRYRAAEGCVEEEYVFARGGQTETKASVHWVYTAAEIRRLLEGAGLEVLALYGGLDRRPFGLGAQELFVVTQKQE
jgi:SAM-dependent methyltransferase